MCEIYGLLKPTAAHIGQSNEKLGQKLKHRQLKTNTQKVFHKFHAF